MLVDEVPWRFGLFVRWLVRMLACGPGVVFDHNLSCYPNKNTIY